ERTGIAEERKQNKEHLSYAFNTDDKILKVANLTKRFGELYACNDISFEVLRGEIFGIAGPNGAGKTTLFNCIAGMYGYSGSVIFNGYNITRFNASSICQLGIARTFQIPQLFQSMTVYQNIKVGAHFGRKKSTDEKKFIEKVLNFFNLEKIAQTKSENLKLLDKKLTMLAAAMATEPGLLLLDEPMGGLSPTEIEYFISLVKKINDDSGITIIVIEHLMKVLTRITDRLMILDNGKQICLGLPNEVILNKEVIKIYLGESYA
ncbi:MAG: ABC transporter ATP-binding protein, partial [Actinobacteria bacterium]|nr:ABC transporter ATP-binding protein [Actinomycetota bacterium]